MSNKGKIERRLKIKKRIAAKVRGTEQRPRLVVFKSNSEIYAQIIDDSKAITLVAASTLEKEVSVEKMPKTDAAALIGKRIAEKAKSAGIESVVFDRNGYVYHGRVKRLAEAAREGGLIF